MSAARRIARWSGPLVGATFLSGVFGAIKLADRRFPRIGSPDEDVQQYYAANPRSAVLSATGQATSAASLLAFAWAADRLLEAADGQGARAAHALGAGMAVAALGYSAASTARLRNAHALEPRTAAGLSRRSFVAGGPVHGFGFGLMVGALALAAARSDSTPSSLSTLGAVSSVAGLACPAYFAAEPAGWLIPIGRFTGLAFVAIAGRRL